MMSKCQFQDLMLQSHVLYYLQLCIGNHRSVNQLVQYWQKRGIQRGRECPSQLVSKLKSEAASTLSLMFQIFLEKNYRTPWLHSMGICRFILVKNPIFDLISYSIQPSQRPTHLLSVLIFQHNLLKLKILKVSNQSHHGLIIVSQNNFWQDSRHFLHFSSDVWLWTDYGSR